MNVSQSFGDTTAKPIRPAKRSCPGQMVVLAPEHPDARLHSVLRAHEGPRHSNVARAARPPLRQKTTKETRPLETVVCNRHKKGLQTGDIKNRL
jgi:hypothetical protein